MNEQTLNFIKTQLEDIKEKREEAQKQLKDLRKEEECLLKDLLEEIDKK